MSIARAAAMPNRSRLTALAASSEDRPAGLYATIMIGLLLGTCAKARADAIARDGTVLWRADRSGLHRSEDEGLSWREVARVEDDDEAEDETSGCTAVAAEGPRVAALCAGRLLQSHDGGWRFSNSPAPAKARRLSWQRGQLRVLASDDGVRRDGHFATRFDDGGAWISADGGASWRELPDAAAYDLIDVIPDGRGGAFAWTRVGLVRLRPEPPVEEDASASWAPRLDVVARQRWVDGFADTSITGFLSFPLDRAPATESWRRHSALRTLRAEMRGHAAKLRIAGDHVRRSGQRLPLARRMLKQLRADELSAQAAVVMETAP
jgi:hypothetical protein